MNQPEIRMDAPLSLSNFISMDETSLEAVRKNLGLFMSSTEFRTCRNYYKNTVGHDPQIEELFLLDGLVASVGRRPESLCFAEMKTESKLIAEIFADLMNRRRGIVSDAERPASITELLSVMDNYLSRRGKKENPLSRIRVYFPEHRDLLMACDGFRMTASTGNDDRDISIGVATERNETAIKNGDYILGLLASENPATDFETRLISFLGNETVKRVCKKAVALCDYGILSGLLQSADGMMLNRTLLSETDTLSTLTEPAFGALIIASPAELADTLLLADRMGLHVIRVATVTSGNELSIVAKNGLTSFRTSFLRSLSLPRVYSTTVPTPEGKPNASLSRMGSCTLGGRKHSVVKVDSTGDQPFFSALYGALYAYLYAIAAGVEPAEIGFSCHLTLPRPSSTRMGESLASVLGLYRLQAELEFYGNTPTVEQGNDEHPLLETVAIAPLPARAIPCTAIGNGTSIFYLEPIFLENGLPDFEDLKKMLNYLRELARDGHILSAVPTSGDFAADFEKMTRNIEVTPLYDDTLETRIGGILVETKIALQGTEIAKTQRIQSSSTDAE